MPFGGDPMSMMMGSPGGLAPQGVPAQTGMNPMGGIPAGDGSQSILMQLLAILGLGTPSDGGLGAPAAGSPAGMGGGIPPMGGLSSAGGGSSLAEILGQMLGSSGGGQMMG